MAQMKKGVADFELPTSKSIPLTDMEDFTWFLYGERKIGKTSLISMFKDVYFLMFEPGGSALEIMQTYVPSWSFFTNKIIPKLKVRPNYCRAICIDTGFMAYERCVEYCMKELELESPSDEAWGNAWKYIAKEFRNAHQQIIDAGFSIICLAHSELQTVKKRNGFEYTKIKVNLGKQAGAYYGGTFDIVGYYHYDENGDRVLQLRGDAEVDAGIRVKNHFDYTNGNHIKLLPLGNKDESFAYEQLKLAFNNKLSEKGGSAQRPKKYV